MGGAVPVTTGLEDGGGVVEVLVVGMVELVVGVIKVLEGGAVELDVFEGPMEEGSGGVVAGVVLEVWLSPQPEAAPREARATPPMTIPAFLRNSRRDRPSESFGFAFGIPERPSSRK
jgi:hypothetical protein